MQKQERAVRGSRRLHRRLFTAETREERELLGPRGAGEGRMSGGSVMQTASLNGQDWPYQLKIGSETIST